MGKYTIVISGEGPHHNDEEHSKADSIDSNIVAEQCVRYLKKMGHQITSAVFNTETTTDDLHALTTDVKAPDPDAPVVETGAKNDAPKPENVMRVFKFEAKDGDTVLDTIYVQGETEDAARQTFKDRGFDDVPDDMLTITESALPEGEELLNP